MAESYNVQENTFPAFDFSDYFFRPLPADIRYKKVSYQTYEPISSIGNVTKNVYITLPKWDSNSHYLLDRALLKVKVSVVGENGEALPDDSECAPVNNMLWSVIEDCQIKINHVSITRISNNYGYKNLLETVLTYSNGPKLTYLAVAGFAKDYEDIMDSRLNPGFNERMKPFSTKGKDPGAVRKWHTNAATFVGKLSSDLEGCPGILNGCEIRLLFTLADTSFFLSVPADVKPEHKKVKPKFIVSSLSVIVPVAELSDSVAVSIERRLKDTPARYHFRRRGVVPYIIPQSSRIFNASGVFPSNDVPARIVLGFVLSQAMKGDITLNPYNFGKKFGDAEISEVKCTLNGNSVDGYPTDDVKVSYFKSFLNLDMIDSGETNDITLDQFADGNYLLSFDFTTALNAGVAFQAPVTRQGQVIFDVSFTAPTPKELVLLCYCEHASNFQITTERKIQTNF